MSKKIDQYLKYVYYSSRDLNHMYTILARLNQNNNSYEWLNNNLINEQISIKNNYVPNTRGYVFSFEKVMKTNVQSDESIKYWIGLNVQSGKSYEEFINDVKKKSIKIYVSLDRTKVKETTDKIFKFLSDNNIECQSKIGKHLRVDTLTIRVCNKEDVNKVINFINSMDYTPNVFPNPFLMNMGKVSIARDGGIVSYNEVLSNYISDYFYYNTSYNENHNDWKDVNCADFIKFLEKKLLDINKEKEPDLYMITDLICRNASGTLTLEDILNYGEIKEKTTTYSYNKEFSSNIDKSEEYKILITKLSDYYDSHREYMINERKEVYANGIDYAHAVIETYLKTGNIGFFTRKYGNIRNFVQKNFDVYTMRTTVNNIGWNSIIEASKQTILKYNSTANITGKSNEKGIIEKIFRGEYKLENGQGIFNLFTNNNNVRSRLGYLISPSMARNILISRLNIDPYNYNPTYNELENNISEIINVILEELSLSRNSKII